MPHWRMKGSPAEGRFKQPWFSIRNAILEDEGKPSGRQVQTTMVLLLFFPPPTQGRLLLCSPGWSSTHGPMVVP